MQHGEYQHPESSPRTYACGAFVMTHTRKTSRKRSIDAGERPSAWIDEDLIESGVGPDSQGS